MSSVYAGISQYSSSAVVPSDGDPAVAESVNVAIRRLLNNTVYLNTQLAHQAFDDRGKTSTITGAIVLNDGGGSLESNIPSVFNGGLETFSNPLTIHSSSSLNCKGPAEFESDVTVGEDDTDELIVNSSLTQNGPAEFWDPVTLHSGATLEANGNATLEGDIVIIGEDGGGKAFIVYSTTVFTEAVVVDGALQVGGNATLGSNASDVITAKGPATFQSNVTCEDDLQVDEDLTVSGDANIDGDLSADDITCQDLTAIGDVVLGNNSSSDTLTVNALLTGALSMGENGRIINQTTTNSSTEFITLSSPRRIFAQGGATRTLTIDDTGMVEGDEFLILFNFGGGNLTVNVSGYANSVTATSDALILCVRGTSTWRLLMLPGTHDS